MALDPRLAGRFAAAGSGVSSGRATRARPRVSTDFVKLRSFVSAVDCGSMSRAAAALQIAQPALSQHVAALESFFQNQLLIRSRSGVVPTEAGTVLYRHARVLLRQLEQARLEVTEASASLKGHVTVGLTTFSSTSSLAIPLLQSIKARHPDVVLTINDSFGHVLSERVALGRMDLELIHSFGTIKGVQLRQLRPGDPRHQRAQALPLRAQCLCPEMPAGSPYAQQRGLL